jgi:Xaa-Pro dipeptidase
MSLRSLQVKSLLHPIPVFTGTDLHVLSTILSGICTLFPVEIDHMNTSAARDYLRQEGLDGWLVYEHRQMNPVFAELVGDVGHLTRPCFLWIPVDGPQHVLAHAVEVTRFSALGESHVYSNRGEYRDGLGQLLKGSERIAMEYSPYAELPLTSRVDGGTLDLVRSFGVDIVSSANLITYVTARWDAVGVVSHKSVAHKLTEIVQDAFSVVGGRVEDGITEFQLAEYIRQRFKEKEVVTLAGPVVAVNEHSSDPHYEPTEGFSMPIRQGDWLLIDLWGREIGERSIYADITWTAYVGGDVPKKIVEVFETVLNARDAAVSALIQAHLESRSLMGQEVDQVARNVIAHAGFSENFTHRLGHSIGSDVHGNGPNLDGFETSDTRRLIPGLGFSIEPGIYLQDFGVRSEINVYLGVDGPEITTDPQREIVLIDVR